MKDNFIRLQKQRMLFILHVVVVSYYYLGNCVCSMFVYLSKLETSTKPFCWLALVKRKTVFMFTLFFWFLCAWMSLHNSLVCTSMSDKTFRFCCMRINISLTMCMRMLWYLTMNGSQRVQLVDGMKKKKSIHF